MSVANSNYFSYDINWEKKFKNEPSKMCGRQPLKNLMEYDLPKAEDLEKCFEPLKFSAFGR